MATRGRPENDGASFLCDETSPLLLSSSPSHCAIISEISCFIQELCKYCAAGGRYMLRNGQFPSCSTSPLGCFQLDC